MLGCHVSTNQVLQEKLEQRESVYNQILETSQQFLENTEDGPETEQLKKNVDEMAGRWEAIKDKTTKDQAVIDKVLPLAKMFRDATDEFTDWLVPAERKLENFEKLFGDRITVARQQSVAKELSDDVLKQKPQFDTVEDSGKSVAEVAVKDIVVVKKEFDDVAGRWEKLQVDHGELTARLSVVEKLLEEFDNRLEPILKVVEHGENILNEVGHLGVDVEKNKEQVNKIEVRYVA